jgi:hypothetical protein
MTRPKISTEDARHIASNPDGCEETDLRALAAYIGTGCRPTSQAAALWPNEYVEQIDGYQPTAPVGRLHVAQQIRAYCHNAATARDCRKRGKIQTALQYEAICDHLYQRLPAWAQW